MNLTVTDLLIIVGDSLKEVKCEKWTAEQIQFRYPLVINWLITLDAEKILGKGKKFPVSPSGGIPDRIEFHKRILFWNPKFTILGKDIFEFLLKAVK